MKLFIFILFCITLQANEFPLVQPFAVERASQANKPEKQKESLVQKVAPKKVKTGTTTNTKILNIHFLPKSATFAEGAQKELHNFASYLLKNKSYQAVIYSYTDNTGDKKQNLLLSQQRANNIIDVLKKFKVSSTKLTAIGMGQQNPIAENDTQEGRAQNRRIEALIIK